MGKIRLKKTACVKLQLRLKTSQLLHCYSNQMDASAYCFLVLYYYRNNLQYMHACTVFKNIIIAHYVW